MKLFLVCFFCAFQFTAIAQFESLRTSEDGISRLLNNESFVNDVIKLGSEKLTPAKLDIYLQKYIPEYSNFRLNSSKISLDNIYFANFSGVSPQVVADKISSGLNLNPTQSAHFQNLLNGNINFTPTNSFSKGYGNKLYERGKDPKVDYAVDFSVDMFQGKFGDGGFKSALIDIGGGILGNLLTQLNKRYYEKLAAEEKLTRLSDDYYVYTFGFTTYFNESQRKYVTGHKPDQEDLYNHFKATLLIPGIYYAGPNTVDFNAAIDLLDKAINAYRDNPERAFYLYKAYIARAKCKMQIGAYKPATIDYYYAEEILTNILSGRLPDNSIKNIYPFGYFDSKNKKTYKKGKINIEFTSLNKNEVIKLAICRAFSKYRLEDYKGSIADCSDALKNLSETSSIQSGDSNDFRDFLQSLIAMNLFGLEKYQDSYKAFELASINDNIFADIDNDGITNYLDGDDYGEQYILDIDENVNEINFEGLPNYFPFDIAQIKGLALYKANRFEDAINVYENILIAENTPLKNINTPKKTFTKVGGDISSVYSSLASFHFSLGNKNKAIDLLDNAISINPEQLEYYYKRAVYKKSLNLIKESEADFNFVRNPVLAASTKKGFAFYETKFAELNEKRDFNQLYQTMKEGLESYPGNAYIFGWAVYAINNSKSSEFATELSDKLIGNAKEHHFLKYLSASFKGNIQQEEQELIASFNNGLVFYELMIYGCYKVKQRPYFCGLFLRYANRLNNFFVEPDFNRAAVLKRMDSIYESVPAFKNPSKTLLKLKKQQYAKVLGEIEELSDLLDEESLITAGSAMDKVECLFLLNKKSDAIKYANRVKSKVLKINVDMENINAEALQNIASGNCQ